MKGDYNKYITEYASGDLHEKATENGSKAYQNGMDLANSFLKTTDPIRLGLGLRYSEFYYQVLNEPNKASNLAKQTFDDAHADFEQIEDEHYTKASTIMLILRDNLTLWDKMQNHEIINDDDDEIC